MEAAMAKAHDGSRPQVTARKKIRGNLVNMRESYACAATGLIHRKQAFILAFLSQGQGS
jgi:hypothetical protein